MWSNSNEYCLSHIFSFLQPHDWINVSEVCRFWREVASRKWKNITEIDDFGVSLQNTEEATVISAKDAKKIVFNAAPYIEVLKASNTDDKYFMFGDFCYKVEGRFEADTILEILIARATEVISASFYFLPKIELMRLFLLTNNVKVLSYYYSEEHHQQMPTHGIEELTLHFYRDYSRGPAILQVKSFKGLFPNLKSLALDFYFESGYNINEVVPKVLSYFREVTCLKLIFEFRSYYLNQHKILNHILLHSQLEELAIEMQPYHHVTDTPDIFLSSLRTCCPKIRALDIDFYHESTFNELSLLSVMSLPELERLTIGYVPFDLSPMEFPEMKNLSELKITFTYNDPSIAGIFGAVTKMPKLKKIVIDFSEACDDEYFSKHHEVQLICNLALAASSQGKDVLVTNRLFGKDRKLQIKRNVDLQLLELVNNECQTLHLASEFENEKESFEVARDFLRKKLHRCHVFIS